jgi:hypothetical protein
MQVDGITTKKNKAVFKHLIIGFTSKISLKTAFING